MKIKCVDSRVNVYILASTSVPFILTTVQVPNLALTHNKWITVCIQHCFICRPSDSTVSNDAGIESRTVATLALASDAVTTIG